MSKAIPAQHPAVVLRSHYNLVRALLAIAMIAVVGLTTAVVITAIDDHHGTSIGSTTQQPTTGPTAGIRYDGGPEEGTAALTQRRASEPSGLASNKRRAGVRYDGGPEEGTRGLGH